MNRQERQAAQHAEMRARIGQVLRFEQYYGRRLRERSTAWHPNEVNAAESGIFRELMQAPRSARWLRERLHLDGGYLSRNLRWLELVGHVAITVAPSDRRQRIARLTGMGLRAARLLEVDRARSAREMLEPLPRRQQRRLARAMAVIVEVLERDALTNLVETVRQRD